MPETTNITLLHVAGRVKVLVDRMQNTFQMRHLTFNEVLHEHTSALMARTSLNSMSVTATQDTNLSITSPVWGI